MSTQQTAKTQFVSLSDSLNIAYRTFGNGTGTSVPMVLLMHFRGSMDHWDPALINTLSEQRRLILLDNAGVGKSSGEVPTTIAEWADVVITFLQALKIPQVDLLGFSMGGFAAQITTLNAPSGLIRKLILAGTMPSYGPGVVGGDPSYLMGLAQDGTDEDAKLRIFESFYYPTDTGRAIGQAAWDRIGERQPSMPGEARAHFLHAEGIRRQLLAAQAWGEPGTNNSYDRLGELNVPVLVANGDRDAVCPTPNSWVLFARIPNARLSIYPSSGHGFLYQYAAEFAQEVGTFLDGETAAVVIPGSGYQTA